MNYNLRFIERRKFISGFTGSAGTALIGLENAYLWTDGRYFLQAEIELANRPSDESWELMRSGQPGVLEPAPFIVKTFQEIPTKDTGKVTLGIDASYITTAVALGMINVFKNTNIL